MVLYFLRGEIIFAKIYMMKKLLFSLLALPFAAVAQPTLVSVTPTVGDSMTAHFFEYQVPTYPKSGNHNWDFSALSTTVAGAAGAKFVNPATTPNAADFPTANICQRLSMTGIEVYLYGQVNADSLWSLGTRYPALPMLDETYVNPDVRFVFPFTYNQTKKDVWSNTNGDVDSSMTKYVGWGNIKTPFGDFNNVILVEDYMYNTVSNAWEVENYNWISVATMWQVADIDAGDSTGTWYTVNAGSTATQDLLIEKYKFEVYPNPSVNQSTISFMLPSEAEVSIQLIAVDGKSINTLLAEKRNAGTHRITVPSESLASGTYFVRMLIDNSPIVKTLTVVK